MTSTQVEVVRPDYPLHASSFFASLCVHCGGIALLTLLGFPGGPTPRPVRPIYDELIKPHEHEILYYDFRTKIREVDPVKKVGRSPEPRGAKLSDRTILASSPKPKSNQVLISVPAPKLEIHQDLAVPLLVATAETILPPPPPRPTPKRFVPPPASKQEPKLPLPVPVAQAPALEFGGVTAPVQVSMPTVSFAAPPPLIPEASKARPGSATADIAVASLVPDAAQRVPNGELPASFSKAPIQGEASSGDAKGTASITAADLTLRQPKQPTTPATPTRAILYAEKIRGIPLSTLSAPLRPASRTIPQAVESRLQGRNVYTMVVPMERMPTYAGDWILWFADRAPNPGASPLVRAPIPFRKLEPVTPDQPPPSGQHGERIQLAAILGKDGKLDGIVFLTNVTPAAQRAVFQDLTSWEFQPATRDGVPVGVDVVLEIPFNLPTLLARSVQP